MNIYVGNLSRDTDETVLRQTFEGYGQVESCSIIKDKFSGESRGFAFVQMPNQNEAIAAVQGLNDYELDGHTITVNEARPRADSRPGRGSGPGRGGPRRGGRPNRGGRGGGRGGPGRGRDHRRGDNQHNRW